MRIFLGLSMLIPLLFLIAAEAQAGSINKDCTFNGKKLWGTVEIVKKFPDVRVEVVGKMGDLKVEKVKHFADSCGKWEFVDTAGDLKVEFVKVYSDITIEFVTAFPGLR